MCFSATSQKNLEPLGRTVHFEASGTFVQALSNPGQETSREQGVQVSNGSLSLGHQRFQFSSRPYRGHSLVPRDSREKFAIISLCRNLVNSEQSFWFSSLVSWAEETYTLRGKVRNANTAPSTRLRPSKISPALVQPYVVTQATFC